MVKSDGQDMAWTVNKNGFIRLWATSADPRTLEEDYKNGDIDFPEEWNLNKLPKRSIAAKIEGANGDRFVNLLKSQAKRRGKDNDRGMLLTEFRATTKDVVKGSVRCIKGHPFPHQFPWIALGGVGRPPEVYDVHRQQLIYRGKRGRHYLGHQYKC